MGKSLTEIAQELMVSAKKVQLIYAFNGVGKTRLSGEFKQLVRQQETNEDDEDPTDQYAKILYYNAFTEDLFYWNNDLDNDTDRKLIIHTNSFTDWILKDQGLENEIANNFSHYTNTKVTPNFTPGYSEVTFSIPSDETSQCNNIKISKSEESNFKWCVFYSMLNQVIEELNTSIDNRSTAQFNNLKYIFIDDPVTSLDENHLIELAVDLAQLIKSGQSTLQFIITTHNPLFYNILSSEFEIKDDKLNYRPKNCERFRLYKFDDCSFEIEKLSNNSPFSYHLFILAKIKKAIDSDAIEKCHFSLLRNVLEKLAVFLGHSRWGDLLDSNRSQYQSRLLNHANHSRLSDTETPFVTPEDQSELKKVVEYLIEKFKFKLPEDNNDDIQ